MRIVLRWIRKHPRLSLSLAILLALFALLNVAAYRHAYAMTHFLPDEPGAPPRPPLERMTFWQKADAIFGGVHLHRPRNDRDPSAVGLPFEVHAFAGRAGRLEGWYVPHPRAAGVVLMLHGYTGCKSTLLGEAQAFHDLGYACFLLDFRGSGGSEGDATTIGCLEGDDVARAAAYVRAHWPGPLVLFGRSMGAAAALRALAAEGVEADAAVLECPFDRLLSAVEARCDAMGVLRFPTAPLLVFWGGVQHGFDGFAHNPVDYAARVRCPTLLQLGRADSRVSLAAGESIFARLAGPKRLHVFDGLDHVSYVAKREAEWKEEVGRFLASSLPTAK
jgi:pimeloyl-ACP methyl ester carboxylesterase